MAKTQTGLRIDPDALDRAERVAAKLSERAGGLAVSRADAVRVALERGLEVLEVELGLATAKRGAKKTVAKPSR